MGELNGICKEAKKKDGLNSKVDMQYSGKDLCAYRITYTIEYSG